MRSSFAGMLKYYGGRNDYLCLMNSDIGKKKLLLRLHNKSFRFWLGKKSIMGYRVNYKLVPLVYKNELISFLYFKN